MEGKKCRAIGKDCQAVSEVYGQLLMISIVVISFSTIALTVFSDGGAVKPEHVPHIDLSEKIDTGSNTVQIVHSGGEAIDLEKIKVILYIKSPDQTEFKQIFDMSDPLIANDPFIVKTLDSQGSVSSDAAFTLGDCIVIYTNSNKLKIEDRRDLKIEDSIDIFIIDIPSQQVIQRAVLQKGPWKLPDWITPHPYGSIYSSSSGWLPTELVSEIKDGLLTNSTIPKNDWISEDYTFGIDTNEMEIPNSFRTFLRIIYQVHDDSPNTLTMNISTGSDWVQIAPSVDYPNVPQYHDIQTCLDANGGAGEITGATTYNITEYVKTADELEKLKVRFSFKGNANITSEKVGCVDFVGIHVEY